MNYRVLGKTGFLVSEISLGTWQLGAKWGEPFSEKVAKETLEAAYQAGINLIDTADIYQAGCSERAVGEFIKTKKERIYVVTKCGRKLNPHTADGYNAQNIRKFVKDSLDNMGLKCLDLVLLHCPPSEVYAKQEVFDELDLLKKEGLIAHYGVSVERIDEALEALKRDISAIEIIFNMFRLRPADDLFAKASEKNVGIIVRVPLASGLLTGRYTEHTQFGKEDHRSYNRNGDYFDKGETFSGVDYVKGVHAAARLKDELHTDNLALSALRYILMYEAVSTVIPGASSPQQITSNAIASTLPPFTEKEMQVVRTVYEEEIKKMVHHCW